MTAYQFLKKYRYFQPLFGLFMLVISPIYVPIAIMIMYFDDIKGYYEQCIDAIRMKIK